MDIQINILPAYDTLIGVRYEKIYLIENDKKRASHNIHIGLLFLTVSFMMYERGSI